MDVIVKQGNYKTKVIPSVAEYTSLLNESMYGFMFNPRNTWKASKATPAFSILGLCNPITCNVGLHSGAIYTK